MSSHSPGFWHTLGVEWRADGEQGGGAVAPASLSLKHSWTFLLFFFPQQRGRGREHTGSLLFAQWLFVAEAQANKATPGHVRVSSSLCCPTAKAKTVLKYGKRTKTTLKVNSFTTIEKKKIKIQYNTKLSIYCFFGLKKKSKFEFNRQVNVKLHIKPICRSSHHAIDSSEPNTWGKKNNNKQNKQHYRSLENSIFSPLLTTFPQSSALVSGWNWSFAGSSTFGRLQGFFEGRTHTPG